LNFQQKKKKKKEQDFQELLSVMSAVIPIFCDENHGVKLERTNSTVRRGARRKRAKMYDQENNEDDVKSFIAGSSDQVSRTRQQRKALGIRTNVSNANLNGGGMNDGNGDRKQKARASKQRHKQQRRVVSTAATTSGASIRRRRRVKKSFGGYEYMHDEQPQMAMPDDQIIDDQAFDAYAQPVLLNYFDDPAGLDLDHVPQLLDEPSPLTFDTSTFDEPLISSQFLF
jgi:hypothetical protein